MCGGGGARGEGEVKYICLTEKGPHLPERLYECLNNYFNAFHVQDDGTYSCLTALIIVREKKESGRDVKHGNEVNGS